MQKLPILSGKLIIKAFEKIGYVAVRQRGSHVRLACDGRPSISVPLYPAIDRGILKKIIREAEITPEEFVSLL